MLLSHVRFVTVLVARIFASFSSLSLRRPLQLWEQGDFAALVASLDAIRSVSSQFDAIEIQEAARIFGGQSYALVPLPALERNDQSLVEQLAGRPFAAAGT